MTKQIATLVLSTFFGVGAAMAAPQAVAPQAQDQNAPAEGSQPYGHRHADPNRQLKMLTRRLSLTADQQSQILPILTNRQQQMESIRSDNSLSPKDRREKIRGVREQSESQLRSVLSKDQQQTYDQFEQRMRDRARENRAQRQNPGQGSDEVK